MPRGKELEQLPMANNAPSMGKDHSNFDREVLGSLVDGEQPKPYKAKTRRK